MSFSLRSSRASVHCRPHVTTRKTLNHIAYERDAAKRVGWWNHDYREFYETPFGEVKVRTKPAFKAAFAAGDSLTLYSAMRFGAKLTSTMWDAERSAEGWQSYTDVYEYRHTPATRAYEDQVYARLSKARRGANSLLVSSMRSRPVVHTHKTPDAELLERVTTTGSSGLGKAKKKVSC